MVSPANRPSGRGDNCAETASVTAGLLGATSRPPVCGVYQGGLSPPLVVCVTRNARIDVWSRLSGKVPGRFDPDRRTKSQLLLSLSYER